MSLEFSFSLASVPGEMFDLQRGGMLLGLVNPFPS